MAYKREVKKTASDLKEKLKFNPSGAYFLFGQEEYLKEFYAGEIKKLVPDDVMELNYTRIYLDDMSAEAFDSVLNDLRSPPVMSDYRVTLVRGLEPLKIKEDKLDPLYDMVSLAQGQNILVIMCSYQEYAPDFKASNGKAATFLRENTFYMECERQSEARLVPWVERHFAAEQLDIPDVCSRRLIALCDGDMTVLDSEIKKLSAFCHQEKLPGVTREIIEQNVSDRAEYDMYDLGNRIMACDRAQVAKIYFSLKRQMLPVNVITSGISRAITGSMTLGSAALSKAPAGSVERAIGLKEWQQARVYRGSFSRKTYLEALDLCLEADVSLKSTGVDEDVVCEELIAKLLELFAPGAN